MRPGGRWGNRSTVVAVAASAATVSALAVGGIALADNGSDTGSGSEDGSTPTAEATTEPGVKSKELAEGRKRFGHRLGGPAMGLAAAPLHGEFVVRGKADGEYQTVAVQRGSVQSVSASAITVKSADGFVKTYAVADDTFVNAKRDGIGSVDKGDAVGVVATVDGESATAVRVADLSQRKEAWERLRPGRKGHLSGPGPWEDRPRGESGSEGSN